MDYEQLMKAGERILAMERAINLRLGVRRKDDTLPERFFKETIPTGPSKGVKLDKKKFERMVDEYYDLRGWDKKTGFIAEEKLEELEMDDILSALESEGLVASQKHSTDMPGALAKKSTKRQGSPGTRKGR